ncbi:MAG: hypothetical protein ACRDBY_07990 [Cetobacterium sp.]
MIKKIIKTLSITTILLSCNNIKLNQHYNYMYSIDYEIIDNFFKDKMERAEVTPNGRLYTDEYEFVCTFYGKGDDENGAGRGNINAIGSELYSGTIASNNFQIGTHFEIDGLNEYINQYSDKYVVLDTGHKDYIKKLDNKKYKIDVFVEQLPNENTKEYKKRISNLGIYKTKAYLLSEE